jgi:hypothetical protein
MSRRPLLICDRGNDIEFLEALEPIRESAGRDTGVRLQDFKTTCAKEKFSKQKQGPPFAHGANSASNRAGELFNFGFAHGALVRLA